MSGNLYDNNLPTTDIMLQAFYWDTRLEDPGKWYKFLESKVDEISEAKISLVWMPPPSKSRVWTFVGYTPMDYYDLGEYRQWVQDWDSATSKYVWSEHPKKATLYGNKSDLLSLLQKMKGAGIKSIADIVINHRAGQQHNEEGERIRWKGNEHTIASGQMAWGYLTNDPSEITSESGGGHVEDDGGKDFGGNLAHSNSEVREQVKEWMNWLKEEIGFDGWRYDYVKGFAPHHLGEYNYHTNPYISVGEYWDNSAQLIYNWIDGTDRFDENKKSMVFDFPLQSHLKDIFWGTKPFQELAAWKNSLVSIAGGWSAKAVTFLDNHDTYRKAFNDFPGDNKRLVQGYAFLLTHPGIPCIFWNHIYERNNSYAYNKIRALCKFRVNAGITNLSRVDILVSEPNQYVAIVDDRIIVKIGDGFWSPFGMPGVWDLKLSGRGWAIWQR